MTTALPTATGTPQPEAPALIDERIRQAELRLIARERDLRERVDRIGLRLRAATRPRRWVAPALGIAVATFVSWSLLRGRPVVRPTQATAAAGSVPRASGGDAPWVSLVAFVWPLLPAAWRVRVSPTTAVALVSLGLPWAERLMATRTHAPLPTAGNVDLARYAGTWYEIARLPAPFEPAHEGQPSAHYTLLGNRLTVFNHGPRGDHGERVNRGEARAVPGSGNAKLRVTMWPATLRWLPFAWTDHWILYVDDDYEVAVVGCPDRRCLWFLARYTRLSADRVATLMRFAAERGFAVERMQILQSG